MNNISIIGSGFSSLSSACYLAKEGFNVTVYEKNEIFGGRARQYEQDGFLFDMGPTWYWMPDVFESFFNDFKKSPEDYYKLIKLNPGYQVYFGVNDSVLISENLEEIYELFEREEEGGSHVLKDFLKTAENNYNVAVKNLVYKPGKSPLELITKETATKINQIFQSIRTQVKGRFSNPRLIKLLEFPVLFLGAKPEDTPGLYNFMNWADYGLGTWHPKGGMFEVVKGIKQLAIELGVTLIPNAEVQSIELNESRTATHIIVNGVQTQTDVVLSGADYHHTEKLLPAKYRQYSEKYWSKRKFAPSALLFYVGFDCKIQGVSHHTLFFDTEFDRHAEYIYDTPDWPIDPLFYASFPSKTDSIFAEKDNEAATFLIPIAIGLEDTEDLREKYFNIIIDRLETLTNQKLKDNVLFMKSYCVNDFIDDYNSYKGNAYGLANTLLQTAFMRPKIKSKKVDNLFFTGQLTVPGPGVPPAIISGKIAAEEITQQFKK